MAKYDMLLIHRSGYFTRAYGRAEVLESNRIDNPVHCQHAKAVPNPML